MAKFDIILPTWGKDELGAKCFDSIFAQWELDFRVIVIANPKRGEETFDVSLANPDRVLYIHPPGNIGYTKAINAGLALSTAPYVVLMNSDTEVKTDGWLEKLAEVFDKPFEHGMNPAPYKIAAVGPATDRREQGWAGTLEKGKGPQICSPTMTHSGILDVKLWFWCIMLKREAILDIGYLDERFSPGGGDDDDWLIRAYSRGWKAAIQTDVLVSHVGQASWPALEPLEVRSERAYRLLREKYPVPVPFTAAELRRSVESLVEEIPADQQSA